VTTTPTTYIIGVLNDTLLLRVIVTEQFHFSLAFHRLYSLQATKSNNEISTDHFMNTKYTDAEKWMKEREGKEGGQKGE